MTTQSYVEDALGGFLTDPAESDHQRGYLAALLEQWRAFEMWMASRLTPRDIAELDAMVSAGA